MYYVKRGLFRIPFSSDAAATNKPVQLSPNPNDGKSAAPRSGPVPVKPQCIVAPYALQYPMHCSAEGDQLVGCTTKGSFVCIDLNGIDTSEGVNCRDVDFKNTYHCVIGEKRVRQIVTNGAKRPPVGTGTGTRRHTIRIGDIRCFRFVTHPVSKKRAVYFTESFGWRRYAFDCSQLQRLARPHPNIDPTSIEYIESARVFLIGCATTNSIYAVHNAWPEDGGGSRASKAIWECVAGAKIGNGNTLKSVPYCEDALTNAVFHQFRAINVFDSDSSVYIQSSKSGVSCLVLPNLTKPFATIQQKSTQNS